MEPSKRTLSRPTPAEMKEWTEKIKSLYPEWNKKMYSLPTVHFTKNLCQDEEIARVHVNKLKELETAGGAATSVASQSGPATLTSQPSDSTATSIASQSAVQSVSLNRTTQQPQEQSRRTKKPLPVDESAVRGDRAQQRTLQCLQTVCEVQKEAMFVISELKFLDFLSKRKPALKKSELKGRTKGDFDILIIHLRFGILVGEVKSIGFQSHAGADTALEDRLVKIVEQLDKSEKFVKQAVADIAPDILIRKTVILPYVSRRELQDCLQQNSTLQKNLYGCVGAQDTHKFYQLCLLEDDMLGRVDSLQVPDTAKTHLETWWKTRMAATVDPRMSEDLYLQLVARFCGPATTVRVYCPERPNLVLRTDSEAVSAIGEKMFSLMLTEDQFSLVQYDERKLVFVTGPPGTGKSIVLLLKGVRWLREGHDVHVVSTRLVSFAVSRLIEHQLKKMKSDDVGGDVHFHDYDFWNREADAEKAVQDLTSAAKSKGELYVLMDEYATNSTYMSAYENLLTLLSQACPTVYVWTASVRNKNIPSAMKEERMAVPLRCPRNVLFEIQQAVKKSDDIYNYDITRFHHLPLGGPNVEHVSHSAEGHKGEWPVDCFQCGSKIGQILIDDLHIVRGGGAASASTSADTSPPPLTFSDVFILTRSSQLQDSSPFVQGLRCRQIPVLVLSDPIEDGKAPADIDELKKQLAVVARSENEGQVVVARHGCVCGLERKVVVRLPGQAAGVDDKRNREGLEHHDRVHVMSRCAAHLIIIDMPPTTPHPEEEAM